MSANTYAAEYTIQMYKLVFERTKIDQIVYITPPVLYFLLFLDKPLFDFGIDSYKAQYLSYNELGFDLWLSG